MPNNRLQIRRGDASQLVGKKVYEGELLWVIDERKLYIGIEGTKDNPAIVEGEFPDYINPITNKSVVKVIAPDAFEIVYDNSKLSDLDKLSAITVQDAIDELAVEKQNRPSSAIEGNIAVFNDTKDTVDSLKTFTTTISDIDPSDNKIPTELAVRVNLDTKIDKVSNLSASTNYSLVNYNSDGAVISGTPIIDGGTF